MRTSEPVAAPPDLFPHHPSGTVLFEILREANPTGSPRLAVVLSLLPGVAILVAIALASCAAPTLRALRISPVEALRHDG